MAIEKLKQKLFYKKRKKRAKEDIRLNILNKDTHFGVVEAYKAARTNLMFTLSSVEGCKKVIVTSSVAAEGKSTTTCNLAITFAQTGLRVLVIEADLRRPKLHKYLSLSNDAGMAEYLGGFKKLDEVLQHSEEYNLDCITGGRISPNPSELLLSKSMQTLMDTLSERYDYIFVDSPPVNVVTDPVSIAKLMDGAVVVVKQNYTTSESLAQTISTLEFGNIKILGYILNSSAAMRDYSYNRYKYNYGHSPYNRRYSYKYGYYKYGQGYYGKGAEESETPEKSKKNQ